MIQATHPAMRTAAEKLADLLIGFLTNENESQHPDDHEAVVLDIQAALNRAFTAGAEAMREEAARVFEKEVGNSPTNLSGHGIALSIRSTPRPAPIDGESKP